MAKELSNKDPEELKPPLQQAERLKREGSLSEFPAPNWAAGHQAAGIYTGSFITKCGQTQGSLGYDRRSQVL